MATDYKRILVPLDGSDIADSAITVAKVIGRIFGAELSLLTVLPEHAKARETGSVQALDSHDSPDESVPERAYEYLQNVSEELEEIHLNTDFSFSIGGDVASEIVQVSREYQADLVVMATRGRSGVAVGLLSPITDRVIHSSSVPVLVVPRSRDLWTPRTLIVPLDGSELAEQALPHAELISSETGCSLFLIRVITNPPMYGRDPYGGVPFNLLVTEQDERDAEAYLSEIATDLRTRGNQVETHVAKGHPGAQISRLSRNVPGAIVVICTRGSSGLTRWVLGCTADNVIRTSAVPVLAIPPQMN